MSNYEANTQYGCQHQRMSNVLCGNSVDIKITNFDAAEVRADVLVESATKDGPCNVVRLWGQIKDCDGNPVPNALLKLVKVVCTTAGKQYQGMAHTVSDCEGFYQFDLCYCDGTECYKILVSKAYTGPEQITETGAGNCCACTGRGCGGNGHGPCHEYQPIIVQGGPEHQCTCEPKPPCPPAPPCPSWPVKPPCTQYPQNPPCPPWPCK
ncbi:MAG: hypothetical protein RR448_00530 [Niameybacter sp.]|uniref:hypothetical protein n=1 Tax=Niameybacter sp. TaxID=2033640 RepID=UPI002FC80F75